MIFHLFTKKSYGWNTKPHEKCPECWKVDRSKQHQQSGTTGSISASDQLGQLSVISQSSPEPADDKEPVHAIPTVLPKRRKRRRRHRRNLPSSGPLQSDSADPVDVHHSGDTSSSVIGTPLPAQPAQRKGQKRGPRRKTPEVVALSHHIFTKGAWRRARLAKHPTVKLSLEPEHAPATSSTVDAVADSGAQLDVWGMDAYLQAGYSRKDLHPVSMSVDAANKSAIRIDGAFFATVTGFTATGAPIQTRVMVYVSRDVKSFYLSETAMYALGMLSPNFPTPGCALNNGSNASTAAGTDEQSQLNAQDATTNPGP